VADYVHSKGLYFGLYTCIGTETCRGGRPGSYGHYQQDAQTVAEWGLDFIKTDNCHKPSNESELELYTQFSDALNATGRPILLYVASGRRRGGAYGEPHCRLTAVCPASQLDL
jgi:alpha-galactosidase